MTDTTQEQETDPELLQRLGDDAGKWAAEFRKTAIRLGYSDMDEGWLIGWFANAIENAEIVRHPNKAGLPQEQMQIEAAVQAIKPILDNLHANGWEAKYLDRVRIVQTVFRIWRAET